MKTIAAGLMLLLLLFLIPEDSFAHGEGCAKDFWGNCAGSEPSWRKSYHSYKYRHCAKDFWGRCADGQPRWRRHHHHHRDRDRDHDRHYSGRGRDDVDRGAFCHPRRRVVGTEKTSKSQARKSAEDAWMGAVRYDHGERFQDLNFAKDVRHNCDPSTPVSPAAVWKKTYFRCVVEATPCRAPTGTSEERYERRYQEEEGDDDEK